MQHHPGKNCSLKIVAIALNISEDACGDGDMLVKVFVVVHYTLETGYATAH
ncbi:hypothetical protein [Coleofasciculus sp. H7-2]|uniref:hypothetical protein n=1 Tax=Coleofasciculus sp. H7-2 TaxID=3351545 RepID=UPI0036721F26